MKLGVYDAVILFNDDNSSRLEEIRDKMVILKELNKKLIWKNRNDGSVIKRD